MVHGTSMFFESVIAKVYDWIDYYNNDRDKWDLLKLYPKEYHQYLQRDMNLSIAGV